MIPATEPVEDTQRIDRWRLGPKHEQHFELRPARQELTTGAWQLGSRVAAVGVTTAKGEAIVSYRRTLRVTEDALKVCSGKK